MDNDQTKRLIAEALSHQDLSSLKELITPKNIDDWIIGAPALITAIEKNWNEGGNTASLRLRLSE